MKRTLTHILVCLIVLFSTVLSACSVFAPPVPTETPVPSATATLSPTPSKTFTPTRTPRPTATPDLAATQRYDEMYALVQEYAALGYLDSIDGKYVELDDFTATMPQLNYFEWYPTGKIATSFVFSAHFRWSTATRTPDVSGCGVVFALRDNDNYHAVFLDKSLLRFLRVDGSGVHRMGKTRGSDAFDFDNPDEAEFKLVVHKDHAYVFVDDRKVIVYTLAQNVILKGELALGLRSGTNKGYGTRCEMTDIRVWIAE